MLEVQNLSVRYGLHQALDAVSLTVSARQIVVILGANGAGKSTLLKALGGLVPSSGQVIVGGTPTHGLPAHKIVESGLALVPEGRGIFGDLTVQENLTLGAYARRARADEAANLDRVFSLFPRLTERRSQLARTMSGGEQQMVAIGRAMMSAPDVLMLDEPSLGLSPLLCRDLFKALDAIRTAGTSVLLVEQNARQSLAIADRAYLLENARIVGEGSAGELARDPAVQKAYLGGAASASASPRMASPVSAPPAAQATETPHLAAPQTGRGISGPDIDERSIKALVEQAAQTQQLDIENARKRAAPSHQAIAHLPGPTLPNLLARIETAASQARNGGTGKKPRVHVIRGHADREQSRPGQVPATAESPTQPIKIWRRGGVRIYKRSRPDGPLERFDDTD